VAKETAMTTLTARFPEDLAAALEAVSVVEKRPIGAILRDAAESWLSHHVDVERLPEQFNQAIAERRAHEDRVVALALTAVKNAKG
jgi:hypothetical protein